MAGKAVSRRMAEVLGCDRADEGRASGAASDRGPLRRVPPLKRFLAWLRMHPQFDTRFTPSRASRRNAIGRPFRLDRDRHIRREGAPGATGSEFVVKVCLTQRTRDTERRL